MRQDLFWRKMWTIVDCFFFVDDSVSKNAISRNVEKETVADFAMFFFAILINMYTELK